MNTPLWFYGGLRLAFKVSKLEPLLKIILLSNFS